MPRGNDEEGQKSALHELGDQFGQGVGNAEVLIAANVEQNDPDLQTVSRFPVDQDATDELDLDSLEGPDGELVVDAVVRRQGRSSGTIVAYQSDDGRLHKKLTESNLEALRIGGQEDEEGTRRSGQSRTSEEKAEAKSSGPSKTEAKAKS